MTSLKRVETVFIKVSNLESAVKWYKEVLELSVKWKNVAGKAVAFNVGDTDLTLVEDKNREIVTEPSFILFTDEINIFRDSLIQKDIEVSEVKEWYDLRYFSFKDIEGNCIEICSY